MMRPPWHSSTSFNGHAPHGRRKRRGSHSCKGGTYFMRKASFLSLPAFISSRIQRGVAPRPAQVILESFLLRYFAATLRPFRDDPFGRPGLRLTPLPTSVPASRESCF